MKKIGDNNKQFYVGIIIGIFVTWIMVAAIPYFLQFYPVEDTPAGRELYLKNVAMIHLINQYQWEQNELYKIINIYEHLHHIDTNILQKYGSSKELLLYLNSRMIQMKHRIATEENKLEKARGMAVPETEG